MATRSKIDLSKVQKERIIRCRVCRAEARAVGTATYPNRMYAIMQCANGHQWRRIFATSHGHKGRPQEEAKKQHRTQVQERSAQLRKQSGL